MTRLFDRFDSNGDGKLTKKEWADSGRLAEMFKSRGFVIEDAITSADFIDAVRNIGSTPREAPPREPEASDEPKQAKEE